ncbi:MAG: SDR family oxidoreductase [Nitrospirae bacterium]|nr:SDR family oxidoreductase [Nitrospirota bacterium]MBF0618136.1 SDR family oxidoreductase [Nitrospirota bacterium]
MRENTLITGSRGDIGSMLYGLYKQHNLPIEPFNADTAPDTATGVIIHMAAKSPPSGADDILNSNIVYLKKVVDYALSHGIDRMIYFSAVSVYGSQNKEDLAETDFLNSPGIYGASKLFGETYLKESALKHVLAIRFPGILGVKNTTNILGRCFVKLKHNEDIEITNPHRLFNNFICVENIFDFFTSLKGDSPKFDVINVASDKNMTLFEIVTFMKTLLNSKSKIIENGKKSDFFNISTQKAQTLYGFKPYDAKAAVELWVKNRIASDV